MRHWRGEKRNNGYRGREAAEDPGENAKNGPDLRNVSEVRRKIVIAEESGHEVAKDTEENAVKRPDLRNVCEVSRKTGVGEVSQEEKVGVRLPSGSPEKRCTVKLETSGGSARVSPVVHGHER